ncbi:Acetyltransferase (GNAT) family [Staphylococcus saccharolyticus]|uniref:Acetyltransferase (GNAT) family n=2 Tax=Staphylococcus saccharolyticus TaxID=33028 RepID=A0A380GZ04_9STAP|nr:Acetyltransferase (GNAT) family [Staphylococcus saccharolyticus]
MSKLRTHLSLEDYIELVTEAMEKDNYEMYGLYIGDNLASVIGFQSMTTLYYERFIWICDLVTDDNYRSLGYGEHLLTHIESLSKEKGYEAIALSSGLQKNMHTVFMKIKCHTTK